jgi:glyoxylate carboligase
VFFATMVDALVVCDFVIVIRFLKCEFYDVVRQSDDLAQAADKARNTNRSSSVNVSLKVVARRIRTLHLTIDCCRSLKGFFEST